VDAYKVMQEWDRVAGKEERTKEELDKDVPAGLGSTDYEEWKAKLEAKDIQAIIQGLKLWGLPVAPLGPFEVDAAIGTVEREIEPLQQ